MNSAACTSDNLKILFFMFAIYYQEICMLRFFFGYSLIELSLESFAVGHMLDSLFDELFRLISDSAMVFGLIT